MMAKPTLETARLTLRAHTSGDLVSLVELDADPEVRRYVDLADPPSAEDVRGYLRRWRKYDIEQPNLGFWVAEHEGAFVGWFHLRPPRRGTPQAPGDLEIGYRLRRPAWGTGLATDGALELVHHGFALGAPRITAIALTANRASTRVMEKAGLSWVNDWTYVAADGRGVPAVLYRRER